MKKKKKRSTKKKTLKIPKRASKEKDICFIIMPYGAWFDEYYENIYKPAIKDAGLKPFRTDDLYRPSQIIQDIWEYTKKAKIILADLTDKNPNVFYELGLAHAIAKPAVLVTQSIEDIPFDLRALRIIEYNRKSHNWGSVLKKDITSAVKEVLESPEKSIPSNFLESKIKKNDKIITSTEREIIAMKQEIDLMRREIRSRRMPHRPIQVKPKEAEQLIKSYIKRGLPESLIIRSVTNKGAPENWVKRKIDEMKEK